MSEFICEGEINPCETWASSSTLTCEFASFANSLSSNWELNFKTQIASEVERGGTHKSNYNACRASHFIKNVTADELQPQDTNFVGCNWAFIINCCAIT